MFGNCRAPLCTFVWRRLQRAALRHHRRMSAGSPGVPTLSDKLRCQLIVKVGNVDKVVLVNVSSLAPSPFKSVSQSVSQSVTKLATPSQKKVGHITRPIPKRVGVTKLATPSREKGRHKTRDRVPEKGSVTKLATASRKKGRGHKTRNRIPRKGSVTKLATPSRKKARSHNLRARGQGW